MKIRKIIAGMSAAAMALSVMSMVASAAELEIEETEDVVEAVFEEEFADDEELFEEEFEDAEEDEELESVIEAEADNDTETTIEEEAETSKKTFRAVISDSEINEKDLEGEDGWSEYTIPYSYVSNFPEGEAVKVSLDYTKRRSYYASEAHVVSAGHEVTSANVVFIIDRTGSMYDKIKAVKSNLTLMVNTLKEKNIDVNFAVIDFTDDYAGGITFYTFDEAGSKWTKDHDAVIKVLDGLNDNGGEELPFSAYEKLFTESPDWYKTADSNFVFLLTDEDSDDYDNSTGAIESYSKTTRTMSEWVTLLDDLGIYNTVVTTKDLNEYYKDLYEKTGGQVLDITSSDYGTLMADFASHVEDKVTHTVVYNTYEVTAINGEGKVIVKGLNDGESINVDGEENGTIELVVSAADAAKYFSEDPQNPGFTNFKIKDFGLDLKGITLEATVDEPVTVTDTVKEEVTHKNAPAPVGFPARTTVVPVPSTEHVDRDKVAGPIASVQENDASVIKNTGGEFEVAGTSVPYVAAGVLGIFALLGLTTLAVCNKRKQSRR